MKVILLSILAVAMIGVMIPSVFAETYTIENAPNSSESWLCEETNECFLPSTLTIAVGDTVVFANSLGIGNQGHTSTSGTPYEPDGVWDSGMTWPGESYSVTLDEAGTYPFHCLMHPWMVGTITVEAITAVDPIVEEPTENKIPEWVKNIFTWYSQGQISEDEVLNAIKFLVNQGIITLNESQSSTSTSDVSDFQDNGDFYLVYDNVGSDWQSYEE